jgi:hypothetical protein
MNNKKIRPSLLFSTVTLLISCPLVEGYASPQLFNATVSSVRRIESPTDHAKQEVPDDPLPRATKPGGGQGDSDWACPTVEKEMRVIVQDGMNSFTTSSHPTLWFYIPYQADEIQSGSFSITTRDGTVSPYQTDFSLPQTPGVISVTVPSSRLTSGEWYRWRIGLRCLGSTSSDSDLYIDGWIQFVGQNNTTPHNGWSLDNLTRLGSGLSRDPNLRAEWISLLTNSGMEDWAREPVVGSVVLRSSQNSEPVTH